MLAASLVALMFTGAAYSLELNGNIQKYTMQIDKLLEYGRYKEADKMILEIRDCNPNDVDSQVLWVVSLALQSKLDWAQDELDMLLPKYPDSSNLHYAQGVVYLKRISSSDLKYRQNPDELHDKAVEEFKKAIELDKTNYRAYNALGVAELNKIELFNAKKYFEESLKIEPDYAIAIDNLGTIHYLQNEPEKAADLFQQAINLNPKGATAYFHMAQVKAQEGDLSAAIANLNKSISLNKNSSMAYNLLGEVYKKQGNEAAAIVAFKKAAAVEPENPNPYLNLSKIYEQRSDLEFAIEQLKTSLSTSPDANIVKIKIADLSLSGKKYNDAIKYYSQLVEDKYYQDEALKGLATAYFEMAKGSADTALFGSQKELFTAYDYINKAIAMNPNDLELYLAKLKLAKITNQPLASEQILNKIINSPSTTVPDMVAKGDAYATLNRYREARNSYEFAAEATKNTTEDMYLAEIFTYNRNFGPAKIALNNVLEAVPNNMQALSMVNYIQKSEAYSNQQYDNAMTFKKNGKKFNFFMKEYLNRSLAANPANVESNIALAKIAEKEKDYYTARNCYSAVLGASDNQKDMKKYSKKLKKMEKKLTKFKNKEIKRVEKEQKKAEKK